MQKITSAPKRMFSVPLFLITLLITTLSFSGMAQTTIYQENFSGFSNGYIGTNAGSDIGVWAASVSGACNNKTYWGTYDTGGLIDGMGLKTVAIGASCTLGTGSYTTTVATSNLFAYTTISTTGYTGITLEFDWKGVGERVGTTIYDYGRVIYRTGTTGTWQILTTGGNASYPGKYVDKNTTQHTVLNLPVGVNNLAKIQFGFRWDNDNYAGAAPGFSIDNIVVKGTGANCSGTPNAGITALSTTADEPGASYSVSATGYSGGAGITYQWQSNTNSAGWVNVGSSTSSYTAYTGAVAGALGTVVQWRLLTTCTNSSLNNTSSVATFTSTYCTSLPVNDSYNDGITNVTFNTINNNSSANAGNEYSNFTAISTTVSKGSSYNLSVSVNTDGNYTQYQKVWVDWNKDGDFDDAGESYELGTATNVSNGISSLCPFNITVPTDAVVGTTRMRVSSKYLEYATACFNATYDGEVEDYSINIIAGNITLTVAGAYTGASYANGANTIANNASVTATSGTRTGYTVTGWTGTGSVPATGATGSTTFTITQNSTISWNWTCSVAAPTVTNGSGCADITLTANAAGATEYRWYDAATGGTLSQTTTLGQWIVSGLTIPTTYYVAAYNGTCESARTAITATPTTTTAIINSTTGASTCTAGSVTIYAETNDDNLYQVHWYAAASGGASLYTGGSYTVSVSGTTSFYAAAVDGTCESARTEVVVAISGKTWNGSQSSDWNDDANWTPSGTPTSINCVEIPNTTNAPIITTGINANAKSLAVTGTGSLIVNSGASITVSGIVDVAVGANFTLESDGYLRQTLNVESNNNVGKITVKRNSTPMFRTEATGWASPVENQKLYDFALGTVFGRVYAYNEVNNAFDASGITLNSPFELGKGYSIRSPDVYPNYSVSNTPTPITFNGLFYGKPNNGDIGVNITFTNFGNNYVGNPYPSPISADTLLDENAPVQALYFWTHEAPPIAGLYSANNYATYNRSGGTTAAAGGAAPDGIIQVGQGFIAKTNANTLLQFTNDLRVSSSAGQFFKQTTLPADRHRMWLNLSNSANNFNQILIGYIPNATMDEDHQIDAKMIGYAGSSIYSLIENNPNNYVIQGRSLPFEDTDQVPLGFKATQAGTYTIAIDHVDGLFLEGQTIYLVDTLLSTVHNLSTSSYSFLSEQGTFNARFKVVYQENTLSVTNPELNNNNWIVYKKDNEIHIQSNGFDIENVEIYDVTGRLLLNQQNNIGKTFSCTAHFAQQVLLVRVNKTLVKKVL